MKKSIVYTLLYVFLVIVALTCLIPFYLMIINATRSGQEIAVGFSFAPSKYLGANWQFLMDHRKQVPLFEAMGHSAMLAVINTILGSYFSTLTAYAFTFYKFPGSKAFFTILIGMMMIPGTLGMFGMYDICVGLGIINTYWPLIIPSIAQIGSVFFLKQYCEAMVPRAILEAPRIDGAGELTIFHRIVIPIMVPGIATLAIGSFLGNWNSYIMPMLLISDNKKYLLTQVIAIITATRDISTNMGAFYLALALSVAPILLAFAFFSKYFISNINAGAIKE